MGVFSSHALGNLYSPAWRLASDFNCVLVTVLNLIIFNPLGLSELAGQQIIILRPGLLMDILVSPAISLYFICELLAIKRKLFNGYYGKCYITATCFIVPYMLYCTLIILICLSLMIRTLSVSVKKIKFLTACLHYRFDFPILTDTSCALSSILPFFALDWPLV